MLQTTLAELVRSALQAAQQAGDLPAFELPAPDAITIERPRLPEYGDFATPVALHLARVARQAPAQIARALAGHLPCGDELLLHKVDVAGAGFINFWISDAWLQAQVDLVLEQGSAYANLTLGQGRQAQVEFISANPTGPLTVGHGRGAVLGDTMATLLSAAGYQVVREYYFNDGGLQMKNLAESVRLRALQELGEQIDFPASYYVGEYIRDIARDAIAQHGPEVTSRDWTFFRDLAVEAIFADIRKTQERLGIRFDSYVNEMKFFDPEQPGNVWEVVERLRESGATYEADEATWFKASAFGADKDRVLLRSATASMFGTLRATQARLGIPFEPHLNEQSMAFYNREEPANVWQALDELRASGLIYEEGGATWFRATSYGAEADVQLWGPDNRQDPTYRLPDIAYHINKLDRGFGLILDVLGADHIAQFPDIRAALTALGYDASQIHVLSHQFVTLVRDGKPIKMSTRRANYITLDELIDEIGADAVRYFMLYRTPDTQFEFDLKLATQKSDENPVYYIQYAHARTAGILERNGPEQGISFDPAADVRLLTHPAERVLIQQILRLEEMLHQAVVRFEPHLLAGYARDLATSFNLFYHDCRVLDPAEQALSQARMKLTRAAQIALARSLELLGMRAPKTM